MSIVVLGIDLGKNVCSPVGWMRLVLVFCAGAFVVTA